MTKHTKDVEIVAHFTWQGNALLMEKRAVHVDFLTIFQLFTGKGQQV